MKPRAVRLTTGLARNCPFGEWFCRRKTPRMLGAIQGEVLMKKAVLLLLVLGCLGWPTESWEARAQLGQVNPGAVLGWQMRYWDLQRSQPYLFRPVTPQDIQGPGTEGLVQWGPQQITPPQPPPSDFTTQLQVVIDALDTGNYQKALEQSQAALKENPNALELHLMEGLAFLRSGQYYSALDQGRTVMDINPNAPGGYALSAAANLYLQNPGEAIRLSNEALRLKPDNPRVLAIRGAAHYMQGDAEQALKDSQQAIALDSEQPEPYLVRGATYLGMGKPQEALADAQNVIRLEPRRADGYILRGNVFLQQGKFTEALSDGNTAISLNPDSPRAYYLRAKALQLTGNTAESVRDYHRSADLFFSGGNNQQAAQVLKELQAGPAPTNQSK